MKKHTLKDIIRALVAEYLTDDGKTYNTKHYNLSAIIVVGIKVGVVPQVSTRILISFLTNILINLL